MNKKYSELAELFRSEKTDEEILDFLLNYHKNDIADMMAGMTEEERKRLYHLLGAPKVAEIFKYIEEPRKYCLLYTSASPNRESGGIEAVILRLP